MNSSLQEPSDETNDYDSVTACSRLGVAADLSDRGIRQKLDGCARETGASAGSGASLDRNRYAASFRRFPGENQCGRPSCGSRCHGCPGSHPAAGFLAWFHAWEPTATYGCAIDQSVLVRAVAEIRPRRLVLSFLEWR